MKIHLCCSTQTWNLNGAMLNLIRFHHCCKASTSVSFITLDLDCFFHSCIHRFSTSLIFTLFTSRCFAEFKIWDLKLGCRRRKKTFFCLRSKGQKMASKLLKEIQRIMIWWKDSNFCLHLRETQKEKRCNPWTLLKLLLRCDDIAPSWIKVIVWVCERLNWHLKHTHEDNTLSHLFNIWLSKVFKITLFVGFNLTLSCTHVVFIIRFEHVSNFPVYRSAYHASLCTRGRTNYESKSANVRYSLSREIIEFFAENLSNQPEISDEINRP